MCPLFLTNIGTAPLPMAAKHGTSSASTNKCTMQLSSTFNVSSLTSVKSIGINDGPGGNDIQDPSQTICFGKMATPRKWS